MVKKLLLLSAILGATVVAGLGVGVTAASAGEQTGNCNNAKAGSPAADNCKKDQNANANSICAFSGQNDDPRRIGPGRTALAVHRRSYGQQNKSGVLADPSTQNPGKGGPGRSTNGLPQPGYACNGNHGFLVGRLALKSDATVGPGNCVGANLHPRDLGVGRHRTRSHSAPLCPRRRKTPDLQGTSSPGRPI